MSLLRRVGVLASGLTICLAQAVAQAERPPQVVDPSGQPVAEFEWKVHTHGHGDTRWSAGKGGIIAWDETFPLSPRVDVLVRADGFVSAAEHFEGERLDGLRSARIVLKRGVPVEVRFQLPPGLRWHAKATPEAYFPVYEHHVRILRQPAHRENRIGRDGQLEQPDFNLLNLRPRGEGHFGLHLARDTPPFFISLHEPAFLQTFEAGPFTLADFTDGLLEIELPRPAKLGVSFCPPDDPAVLPFQTGYLEVMWQLPGTSASYIKVKRIALESERLDARLNDLAPGTYMVRLVTQPKEGAEMLPGTEIQHGTYHDRQVITLAAGETREVEFEFQPFNRDAFRGQRTAIIRVLDSSGAPASGRSLTVAFFDGHYGALEVFRGFVPENGQVELRNITDRARKGIPGPYTVAVDDKRLGTFSFAGKQQTAEFVFHLAPRAGDLAPNVELLELATGNSRHLQTYRGRVVLLEFWATWCGPCQAPMEKLNRAVDEYADRWKVVVLPVSIDEFRELPVEHSRRRGWSNLKQYWTGDKEDVGLLAPAARAFVVTGVPTAVLIGRDGRILWRGNPRDSSDGMDLIERIHRALDQP